MVCFCDKKTSCILTYGSTFAETLKLPMIERKLLNTINEKNWDVNYYYISKERRDKEIKRDHYHFYLKFNSITSFGMTALDVPFYEPVYSFYKDKFLDDVEKTITETNLIKELEELSIDNLLKKAKQLNCVRWKRITEGHSNIKFKKNYGSLYDMLNYCTKQRGDFIASGDVEDKLKELLFDKNKKDKYKITKKEPNWEQLYLDGYSLQEVLELLKKKYTNLFVKNYYKWSAGLNAVFCRKNEDIHYNGDLGFWVPNKVLSWIEEIKDYIINFQNKKWLKNNRHNRPRSLIWFGASKRGKTTFVKQFFYGLLNYYQFLFDGMESFDENKAIVCLDDFNIDLNHFLPGWKCWLGGQTGFSINPKYGRRRKLNWGHPCIFLSNKSEDTLKKDLDYEEKDYLKENCIIINTGKRKLWGKPKNLEELVQCTSITIDELRKIYWLPITKEDFEMASDIEREYRINEPILIENKKRKREDFNKNSCK